MHISKFIICNLFLVCIFCSCQITTVDLKEQAKKEIEQSEKDFQKMATDKGIKIAFPFYADTSAVIKVGNDSLIKGKDGIAHFYSSSFFSASTFQWAPDFVDASEDGNFGYTYGQYVFQKKDSTGKTNEFKGVFHTVWKKQKDGSWKYVWD